MRPEASSAESLTSYLAVEEAGYRLIEVARFFRRDPGVMRRGLHHLEERLLKNSGLQKGIGRLQVGIREGGKPKIAKRQA